MFLEVNPIYISRIATTNNKILLKAWSKVGALSLKLTGLFLIMKSGIYKITSPTGKIYIGQSVDIERRWRTYKEPALVNSKGQIRLYRSFLKHGVESHTFEVVEMCEVDLLNKRERYWQEYYSVLKEGLNCVLQSTTEKKRVASEETRRKQARKTKERNSSPEWRKKQSAVQKKSYKDNPERRSKAAERLRGCKWYNDGTEEVLSKEYPGEGFVQGRFLIQPTGADNPRSRAVAKLDPSSLEVLKIYAAVSLVEQDGYAISSVRSALYRGFLCKGFRWCLVHKLPVVF